MASAPSLVWFRQDLRLDDNPALQAAIARGDPVLPVFILPMHESSAWPIGSASRWWLHQSLRRLDAELSSKGSRLILQQGEPIAALKALAKEAGADAVFWNRRCEPAGIAEDTDAKAALKAIGLHVESFNAALLFEPWEIKTKEGKPYQVFTPYWKACLTRPEPGLPTPAPRQIAAPDRWGDSMSLDEWKLLPTIDWTAGMRAAWKPGSAGARQLLGRFLDQAITAYADARDQPDVDGTSRLSPHLHFGEISPRTIWHAVRERFGAAPARGPEVFLKELGWREFAHHLLFHFPHTPDEPLRKNFQSFPWDDNPSGLRAWQTGRTGYPLVDAGMRQLWATGWMHNRVRMVAASFLVKHLRLPWLEGAKWFWDTLVDADLANNTLGWQWTAGCGADAAPYFRIFNPITQGEKFDPRGEYIRRWVPELAELPAPWIHQPWKAPPLALAEAGVSLGNSYPMPIVDHAAARASALEAFATISKPAK